MNKRTLNEKRKAEIRTIGITINNNGWPKVPGMFIGYVLALMEMQYPDKTYSPEEIHRMARQVHMEWLRRRVLYRWKGRRPLLRAVCLR